MADVATDGALVRAAQSGSNAAFGQLVTRHQQALRSFLRRVCRNWALADDLAQDVFVAAWTRIAQLRDGDAFRSWLFGMAWRKAAQHACAAGRRRSRESDWVETRDQTTAEGINAEESMALADAMETLSPDQRACVALCLAGGWSHSEAAEVLGMPVGTIKSHVARGRARLLDAIGGDHDA